MINPNTYYTVQAWMVNDLGLRGNELALYAIIWGFSQDGRSEFVGSISYVQELLGCNSRQTAINTLKSLINKGLVVKKVAKNGFDCNAYKALPCLPESSPNIRPGVVQKLDQGSPKNGLGVVQKMDEGSPKNGPNNNINNNLSNNSNKNIGAADASTPPLPPVEEEKKPVKHKYGEYRNVLLTDEEYTKLLQQFPYDLQDRIERLSEYIASKGAKYKSHYATIRSWASRDKSQAANRPARPGRGGHPGTIGPNGIAIDQTKNDLDSLF